MCITVIQLGLQISAFSVLYRQLTSFKLFTLEFSYNFMSFFNFAAKLAISAEGIFVILDWVIFRLKAT